MKLILSAFWIAVALAGSVVTPAMADEWNKETRVEINEPLEIPGKILSPGKYVFKLLDSQSDRHIVEVFSEDGSGKQSLVTTILAIPAYTADTPDKPLIRLEERPSNLPQAIHSWFYPGDNYGWQFVYPKADRLLSAGETPAPAPIPASEPAPAERPIEAAVPAAPVEPTVVEETVRESAVVLVLVPDPSFDGQGDEDRVLPETAGHSATELAAGITMMALGLAFVLTRRRGSRG